MNSSNRLLFAAARGARIEWYSAPHEKWCASAVVSFDNRAPQRIHHRNPRHVRWCMGNICVAVSESKGK